MASSLLRGAARFLIVLAVAGATGCVIPVPSPDVPTSRERSMIVSAASCQAVTAPASKFDAQVNPAEPNQRLMSQAFQRVVNRERCRQGLEPLGRSPAAIQAAAGHARTMATYDFMGHDSPIIGRETLERRLDAEGIGSFRFAAENVARSAASALSPRDDICLDRVAAANATYAHLAEGLYNMWIASSSHRTSVLQPRADALGAGVAVNPRKYQCGEVAAAMVLVG